MYNTIERALRPFVLVSVTISLTFIVDDIPIEVELSLIGVPKHVSVSV